MMRPPRWTSTTQGQAMARHQEKKKEATLHIGSSRLRNSMDCFLSLIGKYRSHATAYIQSLKTEAATTRDTTSLRCCHTWFTCRNAQNTGTTNKLWASRGVSLCWFARSSDSLLSVSRFSIEHIVGVSGLGNRNTAQLIHAIHDLFKSFDNHQTWKQVVEQIWKDDNPIEELPSDLLNYIKNPIIARWWTAGKIARFAVKYYPLLLWMSACKINVSTTEEAARKKIEIG